MAKARAIVKRRKAVRNIRKITRTMELIATARFKKAMDRATEAAAYTRKISEIVADLAQAELQFSHPLLEKRDREDTAILLVLTSNRGLCGGYNASVLRQATPRYHELVKEVVGSMATTPAESDGVRPAVTMEVSGKRGINFFRFQRIATNKQYTHFEDKPSFDQVDDLGNRYIDLFLKKKLDRLDVAYTKFVSASRQTAVVETLLPIGGLGDDAAAKPEQPATRVDYEFLPSAGEILEEIVPAAFKARLFKCFLDAAVSEQIARMVAMKAATENAAEMIGILSRQYNRARQTQITSELSEIIGGAAALE